MNQWERVNMMIIASIQIIIIIIIIIHDLRISNITIHICRYTAYIVSDAWSQHKSYLDCSLQDLVPPADHADVLHWQPAATKPPLLKPRSYSKSPCHTYFG